MTWKSPSKGEREIVLNWKNQPKARSRRTLTPWPPGSRPAKPGSAGLTPLAAGCRARGACPCCLALSCAPRACLLCQRRPRTRGTSLVRRDERDVRVLEGRLAPRDPTDVRTVETPEDRMRELDVGSG